MSIDVIDDEVDALPLFPDYATDGFYDEMFDDIGHPRTPAEQVAFRLRALGQAGLTRCQKAADTALLNMGITFNVYGHEAGTEKIWPFDIIPRILSYDEWEHIEAGLRQRITALNLFIADMYDRQKIVRDGVFPEYMARSSKCFLNRCADSAPLATSGAILRAPTWCATVTARSMCSKTTSAVPRAFPTSWRTAR